MADQQKGAGLAAKMTLKVILGLILLVSGVWLIWTWQSEVLTVFKGFLGIMVALCGVIFLAIAKE